MKKFIVITLIILLVLLGLSGYIGALMVNEEKQSILLEYVYVGYKIDDHLQRKFKWLNKPLLEKIKKVSKKYNVDVTLVCCIINKESNGRNVVSRKNRNGTRDYGIMQVNQVHLPKNPRKLLNISLNLDYGVKYLRHCYKKSKGSTMDLIRLYNQGSNGKAHRYRNWKYVDDIYLKYLAIKQEVPGEIF